MEQMRVAHETGLPPMRPLFLDFPADPACWDIADQFLFGDDILVAPVVTEGAREREVYLPAGADWRDAWTGAPVAGGQLDHRAGPARADPGVRARERQPVRPDRVSAASPGGERLEPRRPQRPRRAAAAAPGRPGRRRPGRPASTSGPATAGPPGWCSWSRRGLYVLFAFVVPVIYNLILSFEETTPATIASLFAPWAGLSNYKVTLLQTRSRRAR